MLLNVNKHWKVDSDVLCDIPVAGVASAALLRYNSKFPLGFFLLLPLSFWSWYGWIFHFQILEEWISIQSKRMSKWQNSVSEYWESLGKSLD